VASLDNVGDALVTVILYVCVVPFCAVTTITIILFPTLKLIELLAEPEVTDVPLTVIVALA
jgi:hypothetical protein